MLILTYLNVVFFLYNLLCAYVSIIRKTDGRVSLTPSEEK